MKKIDKMLIESAKFISEYCDLVDCNQCIFSQYMNNSSCLLQKETPADWEVVLNESPCSRCKQPYLGCAADCDQLKEWKERR